MTRLALAALVAATLGGGLALPLAAQDTAAQSAQSGPTEAVRNIAAVLPADDALLMATDYGLLRATPDGRSQVLPDIPFVAIGLTRMPGQGGTVLASGYGEDGKSPVLFTSADNGASWQKLDGATPIAAMTSLSINPASPAHIVGLGDNILLSEDGGKTWHETAQPEGDVLAVIYAPGDENRLYSSTMQGIFTSSDNGQSWQETSVSGAPVTGLVARSDGRIAAFVYGKGVMVEPQDGQGAWQVIAEGFGRRFLRNFARSGDAIFATADTGAILMSRDEGAHWISFEGSDMASPARIAAGQSLFEENCQSCHGVGGIGESPEDPNAQDEFGFKAPALNNDMHAWHHSDAGLLKTIREGSPRNERMIAWKEVLSDDDIKAILAYVKSTWNVNSLACQGGRHMACMGQ